MPLVVADDSILVHRGLIALSAQGRYDVVADRDDLPSLEHAVAAHWPQVVVTDIRINPASRQGHPPRPVPA
jgi:DNA-binding NarL/FixJ family response regulator